MKFGIVAILMIILMSVAMTQVTFQNDTYYSIKIGEHITKYGVDMKDPFSWHENLPYTYPHWLYDLIIYFIYSFAGFTGLYVTTCIVSSILGITIYLVNSKLTKNPVISFVVTMGVMYLLKGYIAARAQLVTFILFIITIFLIEKFLQTKKGGYGIGLIVISLIIANMHVAVWPFYFVLYLPYIGEYVISILAEIIFYKKIQIALLKIAIKILSKLEGEEQRIERCKLKIKKIEGKVSKIKIKREQELKNPYKLRITKNNNVKWLIVIMIIAGLVGALTPLGDTPYTYLIKTMQGNTTKNINEHSPTTLARETNILCVFVIFLAILIFSKTKIRLSDLFMLGGLTYLMISSRRQLTVFAIICSVILVRLITELMEANYKDSVNKSLKIATTKIGLILIIAASVLLSYNMGKRKFDDKFVDEYSYPVAACDYILESIDLEKARFYNEYNYGSYMLFRGIPVFIDSRADLYSPEFNGRNDDIFMDFINTSNIGDFYEDTFKKYNITHVISYKNSKMNMIIEKTQDKNYKEIYKDKRFVIYERLNNGEDQNIEDKKE